MDPGAAYLLGAGLLGLFGFLGYNAWQTSGNDRRLVAAASARGWSFTAGKPPVVYDLKGEVDGVPFAVVSRRPAGMVGQNRGNVPTVTMVTVPAPRIEGAAAALPVVPDTGGLAFAKALAGDMFARTLLGDEARAVRELSDVTEAFGGSFPSGYQISATTSGLALHIMGPDLRETLAALAEKRGQMRPVVLIRSATQASVRVLETVTDLDEIESLVQLALLLARKP